MKNMKHILIMAAVIVAAGAAFMGARHFMKQREHAKNGNVKIQNHESKKTGSSNESKRAQHNQNQPG